MARIVGPNLRDRVSRYVDADNALCIRVLGNIEDGLGIWRPCKRLNPVVSVLRQTRLLARLAVVQHQPEAVALVSRTLLGAVGDVAAIGRIERRRVAGGIVGGYVL